VTTRVLLGSWRCPSGNSCDVYLDPRAVYPEQAVFCAWDREPPHWTLDDAAHYADTIRPEIRRRVREYLEIVGPPAWVELIGPVVLVSA
jgi:hypothetical protein